MKKSLMVSGLLVLMVLFGSIAEVQATMYDTIEAMPGQIFTAHWYYWTNSYGGSAGNFQESPEVPWLSISPLTFTSTSCSDIVPVNYSIVAPDTPGTYTTTIQDANGNWNNTNINLTVTSTPTPSYSASIALLKGQSVPVRRKLTWKGSDDIGCVKDYFEGTEKPYKYELSPSVDWLTIEPSDFTLTPNETITIEKTFTGTESGSTYQIITPYLSYVHYSLDIIEPGEYALEFDGTDSYASTGYYPDSNSKTLMYWVKFDAVDKTQAIGAHDGNDHRLYLGITEENYLYAGLGNGYIDNDDTPVPSGITLGKWYHLALVGDGSVAKVYVNGVEITSFNYTFEGESDIKFLMGVRNNSSDLTSYVDGVVDEAQIWKIPLTQEQIQTNMNQGLTGKESGLAAYWPFDEGSVDMSGNGHTAVFVDGAALVDSDVHLPQPTYPPDLSVSVFSVPSSATSANPPEITWQIQNTGQGNTAGAWVDRVYLSSDNLLDEGDTLLGEFPRSEVLAAESDYSQTQTLKIPDISPGSYYIILKTDSAGAVEETNEDDNIAVRPFTFAHAKLLTATPDRIELNLIPGSSASGQINLGNIGEINISGISAMVENAAENISINLETPPNLGSLASGAVQYAVTASDDSVLKNEAIVKFTSANGGEASITFDITVIPARPKLVTNPGYLESGMLRGEQRIYEFELSNTGGASARDLQLLLPESSWLKLVTADTIGTLGPRGNSKIQLMLCPPADMNLGPYSGDIVVSGTNTNLRIGFKFTAVSEAKGNLKITATDEFTYFADDHPNVAGAEVIVKDAFSGTTIAEGVTDETGVFLLQNINEGRYSLEVRAEKHGTHHSTIEIVPGMTKDVEAFLQRQLVSYKWSVEPIEIEDSYSVNLEAVFETHVPAPVVTMEPSYLFVPLFKGETTTIDVTITNHGLIDANNVSFNIPEDDEIYMEFSIQNIGTLPAMTSVTIPVEFRAKEDGPIRRSARKEKSESGVTKGQLREDTPESSDPERGCSQICVEYEFECNGKNYRHTCASVNYMKDVGGWVDNVTKIISPLLAVIGASKDLALCASISVGNVSGVVGCLSLLCRAITLLETAGIHVPISPCFCLGVSLVSFDPMSVTSGIGVGLGVKGCMDWLCSLKPMPFTISGAIESEGGMMIFPGSISGPRGINIEIPCEWFLTDSDVEITESDKDNQ